MWSKKTRHRSGAIDQGRLQRLLGERLEPGEEMRKSSGVHSQTSTRTSAEEAGPGCASISGGETAQGN